MMVGELRVVVEKPQQNRAVRGVTVGRWRILPTVEGGGKSLPWERSGLPAKATTVVAIAVSERGRRVEQCRSMQVAVAIDRGRRFFRGIGRRGGGTPGIFSGRALEFYIASAQFI